MRPAINIATRDLPSTADRTHGDEGLTNCPDTCAICGDEEFDMPDTHMGFLCSSCTRKCTICGDWMLDEESSRDSEGNEAHKICADEMERL